MSVSLKTKVLETFHVSPPPSSVPPTTLPLTFFDLPWLFFSPSQLLFFYHFPHSLSHFLSSTLPSLSLSLSLSLTHFFPFAGNLSISPDDTPEIVYKTGDSVSFTVAECESDFDFTHLSDYSPRNASLFYPLVPELSSSSLPLPLLALQVTVFPDSGICIGLSYHYVVADGRTCNYFLKTWASIFKSVCGGGEREGLVDSPRPFYDRTVIKDELGLEGVFLEQWRKRRFEEGLVVGSRAVGSNVLGSELVRATYVMGPNDFEKMRKWIVGRCKDKNLGEPIHLSPSVLACAFLWVCLVRAQEAEEKNGFCREDPNYFGYVAGGLTRLDYPVPETYFGNYVGFCRAEASRKELAGEDGVIVAAKVIGSRVKESDKEFFKGAERWVSDWEDLVGSETHVMVIGSPKLDIYKTDFGWGGPKKVEEVSIDGMRGGSTLVQSRDVEGGIEVGVSLPKREMDHFGAHFNGGLKSAFLLS